MKFTLNWLKDHLETTASLQEVVDALNRIGLVVAHVQDPRETLGCFKTAKVIEAGKHPNADRLTLCTVDTGKEQVQLICGAPNARQGMVGVLALPGMTIPHSGQVFKKGSIRGVESQGMMCSAYELELSSEDLGTIIELPEDTPLGIPYIELMGFDDPVIEIEITPNRGDCLGVRGVARDLAAAGIGILKDLPQATIPTVESLVSPQVRIETPHCSAFAARLIKGVVNKPSPQWLQRRLEAVGQKSISALVDITNYVMMDMGRPSHVFDSQDLKGALTVKASQGGENFKALDEKEYEIPSNVVGLWDEHHLVALPGLMGGIGTKPETTDILLEVAAFDPVVIAQAGRALGIHSDSRYRFERFVDPATIIPGMDRLTALVLDLCGGQAGPIQVTGTIEDSSRTIDFDPALIQTLGGLEIERTAADTILQNLGLIKIGEKSWRLPSWRPDLEGPHDLVEEVLRLYGYDHIPAVPMGGERSIEPLTVEQDRPFQSASFLVSRGFYEVMTWSFLAEAEAALFGWVNPDVRLKNPISQDLSVMRPSLIPGLLKTLSQNMKRDLKTYSFFEAGHQYNKAEPFAQERVVGGIRAGYDTVPSWRDKGRKIDVFHIKEDLWALLEFLGLKTEGLVVSPEAPSWYHPGRSGTVKQGNKALAVFGEIHPTVMSFFDIKEAPCAFELFLDALPPMKQKSKKAALSLSSYQTVERDFAFVVKQECAADAVLRAVRKIAPAVSLFDVYEISSEEKSLAVRVRFEPIDRTLTEEDIQNYSQSIVQEVHKATGGVLRQ